MKALALLAGTGKKHHVWTWRRRERKWGLKIFLKFVDVIVIKERLSQTTEMVSVAGWCILCSRHVLLIHLDEKRNALTGKRVANVQECGDYDGVSPSGFAMADTMAGTFRVHRDQ